VSDANILNLLAGIPFQINVRVKMSDKLGINNATLSPRLPISRCIPPILARSRCPSLYPKKMTSDVNNRDIISIAVDAEFRGDSRPSRV
jgi:hypothetical protein